MFVRILSGVIGFPIIVYIILQSGLLLQGILMLASLVGMHEFYRAVKIEKNPLCYAGYGAAVCYMFLIDRLTTSGIIFTVSLFMLVVLAFLVVRHKTFSVYDAALAVFGFFYVCFLMSNIYLVREHLFGKYAVWLIFISAWGCDTGAYFVGKFFGKHKLVPELSPKKTVEGAVGGVVVATALGVVYALVVGKQFQDLQVSLLLLTTVVVFFGSIFSQLGDLAASSIKRQTGIKDYGNLIPGHGGILDRCDSILFTAPTVYCVLILFGQFGTF